MSIETDIDLVMAQSPGELLAAHVQAYVEVRNERKQLKAKFSEQDAPLIEREFTLAAQVLELLGPNQSAGTPYGTAYKSERATASVADGFAFMEHVKSTDSFELLDRKANVTAVKDFVKEHGIAPPGINFTVTKTLRVLTANAKSKVTFNGNNGDNDE